MKTVLNRSILNGIARMRVRLIALDELFQTVPCSFESDQALASFSKNAFLQGVVVFSLPGLRKPMCVSCRNFNVDSKPLEV